MTKTPPSRSQGHRTASMDALVVHLCRCGEPIEFEGDTLCAYCIANTPKAIEPWPEFAALRAGLNHAERGMRVELARLRRTLDRMTDVLHNATAHVRDRSEAEGGAGMGYHLAGIEVTGVDIAKQPRYPFPSERSEGGIECSIWFGMGGPLKSPAKTQPRFSRALRRGLSRPYGVTATASGRSHTSASCANRALSAAWYACNTQILL